jgi:hypothetical protein
MLANFSATVSALAYSIVRERCGDSVASPPCVNPVVGFVLGEHARMPDYLRVPLAALTLIFDAAAVPFHGRPFHRLPHERRWRRVLAWKHSSLGFRRDLVRFYESLVVFGWYAEVYGPGRA